MAIIYILKFLGVIVSVAMADICWVYYFVKVEERKSFAAGVWSTLIIALGAFSIENYVNDSTFIIAAGIGAFLGTYASIEYKKRKEEKNKKS